MELDETIQHVHNLHLAPDSPQFQESWQIIEEYRQNSLLEFLDQMIQIYTNTSIDTVIRQLALILSYQAFPRSYEKLSQDPFIDLNLTDEIVSQLLTTSSDCFGDEIINIRMAAATLFSRIACIDVLTNDTFNITKTLITNFVSPESEEPFQATCVVLIDLFEVSNMDDEELDTLLGSLFGYLSSDEETITNQMKCDCLKILRMLINNMNDVLTDEDNIKSLFEALFAMAENPETKANAFNCWSEFTVNYYPMLEMVAEQLVESSFVELTQVENDDETVISICDFWGSIAQCELSKKAPLQIISQVVEDLLPILYDISIKIPVDECDNEDENMPHIAAATALQSVVAVTPEESFPHLLTYVKEYENAQGEEDFGMKEGSLNCLNFIIQFCDCSSILLDSFDLIFDGLNDNSPRVRQTAVYCVHAILNSILSKGEECPFVELIPQIGQKIVELSLLIMNMMIGESIDAQVASKAASTTADFIQFPGFPYVGRALSLLLNSAVRDDVPNFLLLSQSAFSALQSSLEKCPEQLLLPILKAILDIMHNSIESNSDFWLINHLRYLLQPIFIRLSDQIDEESVESSWNIFESIFNQYPDEAPTLLSALSTLARAAGELFVPYLETTVEFILNGLDNYDREESIPSAALGVSLLSDRFDLSPYASSFFEALTKAIENETVPLSSKQYLASALGDLAIKVPDVFSQVAETVLEPIDAICQNVIGDIMAYVPDDFFDEDFDIDDILCAFLKCLRNMLLSLFQADKEAASKTADILSDLLEIVGGMKEHGDKLLASSVESMESLMSTFPDDMKESFDDEPGFIQILQEAQAAEILPDVVESIFQFMSS